VGRRVLLEISVETVERAAGAERGGADRIELCNALTVGGLTPGRELMKAVRAAVRVPVFAMIRPRAGDFVYSREEFAAMRESIALARDMGMGGVVLGILRRDGRVDVERTRELVEEASEIEVTFHRAIDEAAKLLEAVDAIAETGAARILTSGGKGSALDGAGTIAAMVERARGRIGIVPGAGITAGNVAEIVRRTGVGEVHAALSTVVELRASPERFEEEVRRLAASLATS